MKTKRIEVRVDDTLYRNVELAATIKRTTVAKLVTELLQKYVEEPTLKNKIEAMEAIIDDEAETQDKAQKDTRAADVDSVRADHEANDKTQEGTGTTDTDSIKADHEARLWAWYQEHKDSNLIKWINGKLRVATCACEELGLGSKSPLYNKNGGKFEGLPDKKNIQCYDMTPPYGVR